MTVHLAAAVAMALASAGSSPAPGPAAITQTEALRLFLEASAQARLIPLVAEATRAERIQGTEFPNPTVAWQIEDAAGVRDEFLTFQQEVPLTGRRSIQRQGAGAAAEASRLRGERDLQNAVASLRTAFHDVLRAEGAAAMLERSRGELEIIVAVLREREQAGEGSGYDVLRTEQEAADLEADRWRAEAAVRAARARFGSFFDPSKGMVLATLAAPSSPEAIPWTAEQAATMALAQRQDLLALDRASQSEDLALRAAGRRRFPEPVVGAGWKRVESPGSSDTGFVASLMVPMPIFDRGRNEASRARASAGEVGLRREMLQREIRAEVESALAVAEAALKAAEGFSSRFAQRADELRRIARLAYEEGESGILELLDAFRTSLRMERQALEARHEAALRRIELDRVMGNEVRP